VSLLTELDAFYLDHRRCGELDAGVEGEVVWFACDLRRQHGRRMDETGRSEYTPILLDWMRGVHRLTTVEPLWQAS
jgi:hypothetical protein